MELSAAEWRSWRMAGRYPAPWGGRFSYSFRSRFSVDRKHFLSINNDRRFLRRLRG